VHHFGIALYYRSMRITLLLTALVFYVSLHAQADRYKRQVFDSVTRHEVNYSDVFDDAAHKADVY